MFRSSIGSFWLAAIAGILFASPAAAASPQYDPYGGWRDLKGTSTGYFHTEKIQGRWWLVTPDGNAFFSKGVCHVALAREGEPKPADPKDPADRAERAKVATQRLRDWNFNTVGAWSDAEFYAPGGLAYTPILGAGSAARRQSKEGVADYFSEEFQQAADRAAERLCAPRAKDPWLLGYFTDNELAWTHSAISWGKGTAPWNLKESLLATYLKLPATSAGNRKANELLKTRGLIKGALTEDDEAGFAELVAAEYARVCREAIRRYDPNHIILGCRFAGHAPDPILRGMAPHCDVISFNNYHPRPPLWKLQRIAEITGKPSMITEFSFKAMDSGLPNTRGAAEPVATQADRAHGFAQYVQDLASLPSCVGFHWFQYRDQPKEGRGGDGENSNYGLVKGDDSPWEVLTARMKLVNGGLESLAAQHPEH